ncbi:unnamed protein product [Ixodes pacificus]
MLSPCARNNSNNAISDYLSWTVRRFDLANSLVLNRLEVVRASTRETTPAFIIDHNAFEHKCQIQVCEPAFTAGEWQRQSEGTALGHDWGNQPSSSVRVNMATCPRTPLSHMKGYLQA